MRRKALFIVCSLTFSALWAPAPRAELLQIIHTNDLHSHLDWANDTAHGGFAAVKGKIDDLKARAKAQGVESLVLDAGDFSEGSVYYLADRGAAVWRTMDQMGYDAVVLGNHDWMMGAKGLDDVVGRVRPSFSLLCANFMYGPGHDQLARQMLPSASFKRAGSRIAILGLTTDEPTYNWYAKDGFISNPEYEAAQLMPKLQRENDFVIALTHLGLKRDKILGKALPGLDLVVGGHSHTALFEPVYVKNVNGHPVPIVQAGEHTGYVGNLLVDVTPGKPLRVVHYGLEEIFSNGPLDDRVTREIAYVRETLEEEYGAAWLYEVIGQSSVPLQKQVVDPTPWSRLIADSLRLSTGADLAIDVPAFGGQDQPAGPVTRDMIIRNYPRMFDFEHKLGWTVWTAQVRGWILSVAITKALEAGVKATISGIEYQVVNHAGKRKIKMLKIAGKPVNLLKNYKVALPEGIGRGVVELHPAIRSVIKKSTDSGIPIWSAIESRFKNLGGPLSVQ